MRTGLSDSRAISGSSGALDWPSSGYYAILAALWPLIAMEIVDALMVRFVHIERDRVRGLLIMSTFWLGGLLAGLTIAGLTRHGLQGFYLAVFGVLLSFLVVYQFRSDFVRAGTFDQWESTSKLWLRPILISAAVGSLLGAVLSTVRPKPWRDRPTRLTVVTILIFACLTAVSFLDCYIQPLRIDSSFPASRPYALLVILATALAVLGFAAQEGGKDA